MKGQKECIHQLEPGMSPQWHPMAGLTFLDMMQCVKTIWEALHSPEGHPYSPQWLLSPQIQPREDQKHLKKNIASVPIHSLIP